MNREGKSDYGTMRPLGSNAVLLFHAIMGLHRSLSQTEGKVCALSNIFTIIPAKP